MVRRQDASLRKGEQWTGWPSDQRINPCKPEQRPVRIDLYGE